MRFIDLNEGPNDPGIFKAVFLAGGPGSGKSFVASSLGLAAEGLRVVNSDDALEYLMQKHNLDLTMPPEQQAQRDVVRQRAKQITKKKQHLYLDGRLGLIIDGTAKDVNKMANLKKELESIGYQTAMIFVNTSLRTALQRNNMRQRRVPTDIVTASHQQVQQNKQMLQRLFGENYIEVRNEGEVDFSAANKFVNKFMQAPVTPQARDWISKAQLQKNITQEDTQSKPKVYVDMDGVIANFYAGVTAATGHEEPRAMALQDIEDTMASFAGTDFFYKLPKYEQADQLIAMVNAATDGDWYILSSPLKYDREGSAAHKARWVKDNLQIQPRGMHFTGNKAQYATQPDGTPNILIDDYPQYLNKWTDAGGIGVKYKGHVGNIDDVKATLDKYLGSDVEETIRKVKGGYRLLSKKGKNLGTYPSKGGAEKREREVQYFKHMGESIVLTEEQLVEGFLDSAKDYLGNAYTKTVADIKSNIVDLKQAGIVIKDVLSNPQQTEVVNTQLGKQINMIVKQMSSTANAATMPMIKFIQQNILPVVRVSGIKGFLGRLGVYGVLKFVSTQLSRITDVVKDQLIGLMADVVKQVSSTALTMSSFMGIFDNLSTVKKYFLDVLSAIKTKLTSVQIGNITEEVTQSNLDEIERYADKLFGTLGIDVSFTRHFIDRVNDERNRKPISAAELIRLFRKEYQRWGKPIAQMGPDSEAVLKDMQTDINIPFVLKWDRRNNELDLIAKTVMRKPDFKTPDTVFPVGEEATVENFADGKKPGRKGLAKRVGVDCSKSETELRKIAKNSSGEKQRMAHWCANMKGGKK